MGCVMIYAALRGKDPLRPDWLGPEAWGVWRSMDDLRATAARLRADIVAPVEFCPWLPCLAKWGGPMKPKTKESATLARILEILDGPIADKLGAIRRQCEASTRE